MRSSADRRSLLKAGGVSLALPALESSAQDIPADGPKARNLVCVGTFLGFYQSAFFPEAAGRDYELPTLLKTGCSSIAMTLPCFPGSTIERPTVTARGTIFYVARRPTPIPWIKSSPIKSGRIRVFLPSS